MSQTNERLLEFVLDEIRAEVRRQDSTEGERGSRVDLRDEEWALMLATGVASVARALVEGRRADEVSEALVRAGAVNVRWLEQLQARFIAPGGLGSV